AWHQLIDRFYCRITGEPTYGEGPERDARAFFHPVSDCTRRARRNVFRTPRGCRDLLFSHNDLIFRATR
ncbi:MAG: hypothetical protein KAI98_06750, partial [Gemmatimonadetes bacterium]|nr:hypothetical protein [Gemmatimonadota bacterium]